MTQYPDLFAALAAPFDNHEVKVRAAQGGRQLHYITARTAMNRLDTVLGPENWWDEFVPNENSVLCKLSIRLPDGSVVTKADAGGYAGMSDSGDDDKSGFSDSFKRAAAKFGVARYLYRDGVPAFVKEREPQIESEILHASPTPSAQAPASAATESANGNGNGNGSAQRGSGAPPRTGRAMFAWTKEQEQRHEVGLLKYLNSWAKLQDFPGRMVDWDGDQVGLAYAEACRKLRSIQPAKDRAEAAEAYEEAIAN